MENAETILEFYERRCNFIPENLNKELGHFNVFKLEPFKGNTTKPAPYKKRDYYKITLLEGDSTIHYADKAIQIQKQALIFTNPQVPYNFEHSDTLHTGYFCIFNQSLFNQYGNLSQYSLFQPDGNQVFELTDEQSDFLKTVYRRMLEELNSDYVHKYDMIRTIIHEVMHFAMKMEPSEKLAKQRLNASQRIANLFLELLERQFPIDDTHQTIQLRTASNFAEKLNVHINHLNRAIKETTEKTTTQIIAERIAQEAKNLLKQTTWDVSEIAYALGFNEVTHFNNFFKKHVEISPLKFRNV